MVYTGTETARGGQLFYTWDPASIVTIGDLPVAFADVVDVSVSLTSPSQGEVVVQNLNNGAGVSVTVNAPSSGANLCATGVAWLVTDLQVGGVAEPFSNFINVLFQNCAATTTTGQSVDLSMDPLLFSMVQNNQELATPSVVSSNELLVSYG